MALLLRTHYKLARDSIRRNRTRSFLTCLGIGVGVASIILILSLTGSIKNLITSQARTLGANLLTVRPSMQTDAIETVIGGLTAKNQYMTSNLTIKDAATIKKIDGIAAAAPLALGTMTLRADDRTIDSATIIGTTPDFASVQNLKLVSGTFLSEKVENAAVIGRSLSLKLFGTATEGVGKTFYIGQQRFIVVGMLEETDVPINYNNVDFDNSMIVNAEFLEKNGVNLQVQQIDVQAKTTGNMKKLAEEIRAVLEAEKAGERNFEVLYGTEISHPAGGMLMIVSGALTLVAGVSLIVGGIGVMNILLVSVAERTREIGIRKAVGANSVNILMQFLFEALILSFAGGLLGMILGYAAAFLVSVATSLPPYISWEIVTVTLIASLSIGVAFGMYPAIKAARKNPIESLRYYH